MTVVTGRPRSSTPSCLSLDELIARKGGHEVSVCIPARDEQSTVAAVVEVAASLHRAGLFDEVLVVDDHSTDGTAGRACAAGAGVVPNTVDAGKGGALVTAIACTRGDVLLFLDADVISYTADHLAALVAPLLLEPQIQLVKGSYRRPLNGRSGEGGRVTELVARPLLERFYPDLAHLAQPLAGETAIRRTTLERVRMPEGYGVEIALLIDVFEIHGLASIVEVDLGERTHRNRPLGELRRHSREVLEAVLSRIPATPGVGALELETAF